MGSIINQNNLISERKEESEEIKELKKKTVEKEFSLADLI